MDNINIFHVEGSVLFYKTLRSLSGNKKHKRALKIYLVKDFLNLLMIPEIFRS